MKLNRHGGETIKPYLHAESKITKEKYIPRKPQFIKCRKNEKLHETAACSKDPKETADQAPAEIKQDMPKNSAVPKFLQSTNRVKLLVFQENGGKKVILKKMKDGERKWWIGRRKKNKRLNKTNGVAQV